jgi:hypothetical protein
MLRGESGHVLISVAVVFSCPVDRFRDGVTSSRRSDVLIGVWKDALEFCGPASASIRKVRDVRLEPYGTPRDT